MGVQGLWGILESTGHPVTPDSLRGKVLAIDVSIWLHQAVKGFRDKDGNPLPNAHLLGLFHRICNLLHSGIRPVFVFDGGVPALKRQTLAGRRQKKIEATTKSDSARRKLLTNYLQSHVQTEAKKALPPSLRMAAKIKSLANSPEKKGISSPQKKVVGDDEDLELKELRQKFGEFDDVEYIESEEESNDSEDFEESSSRNYADNFCTITSSHFDSLDLERQHEILFQMQESKKTNSWKKMGEMPRDAGEFSSFQMDRLLKRRYLQKKIQSVQKEMGQRHIHVQNLDELSLYEAEFGTKPEVVGSKESGALFLKPKPKEVTLAPSRTSEHRQSSPNAEKKFGVTLKAEKKFGMNSDSDSMAAAVAGPSRKEDLDRVDTDMQFAIELSLKSLDVKKDIALEESNDEDDLQKAIQMSLEDTKKVGIPPRPPPSVPPPPQRPSSGRSPLRRKSSLPKSEGDVIVVEKPFEQKIADDLSTPCYKFLGWVGFNDKVPSSSSPVKSQAKNKETSVNTTDNSLSTSPPTYDVSSSSSSDDDFEEVEELIQNRLQIRINPDGHLGEDMFGDIFSSAISQNQTSKTVATEPSRSESPTVVSQEKAPKMVFYEFPVETEPSSANRHKPLRKSSNEDMSMAASDGEVQIETVEDSVMNEGEKPSDKVENRPAITSAGQFELTTNDRDEVEPQQKKFPVKGQRQTEMDEIPYVNQGEEEEPEEEEFGNLKPTNDIVKAQASAPSESAVRMITMDFMQQQEKLESEKAALRGEIGSQDRISTSITDQMYLEGQELLSLFGIPFVVSPMEAEAQCAFLDAACLTDGTITDDSDIWLFGALRVYKNYFAQGERHVQFFQYADIVRKLNLDREKLVLIAMLCGSDYTNGIEGVGPITALEILGDEGFQGSTSFDMLQNFYSWWSDVQQLDEDVDVAPKWREKWRKLRIRPGFPSALVYDAYLHPTVDTSTEQFRWGTPDLDALRQYAKTRFGWTHARTDAALVPALKNFECQAAEIRRQTTLDSFLLRNDTRSSSPSSPVLGGSKRLQKAMRKLRKQNTPKEAPAEVDLSSDSESEQKSETGQSAAAATVPLGIKRKAKEPSGASKKRCKSNKDTADVDAADTGIKNKNQPRIPRGTKTEIPQRRKSIETRKLNKEKAVQVLKKGKDGKNL